MVSRISPRSAPCTVVRSHRRTTHCSPTLPGRNGDDAVAHRMMFCWRPPRPTGPFPTPASISIHPPKEAENSRDRHHRSPFPSPTRRGRAFPHHRCIRQSDQIGHPNGRHRGHHQQPDHSRPGRGANLERDAGAGAIVCNHHLTRHCSAVTRFRRRAAARAGHSPRTKRASYRTRRRRRSR